MSNSNYRPSTRSSSSAPSEVLPAPRPLPRQTPATPSGPKATRDSHPKRGGVSFVELSGHQVIAGKESTSYGSQTAVIPLAMKKIQNTDLESALQDIVGQEVPLNPTARLPGQTQLLRPARTRTSYAGSVAVDPPRVVSTPIQNRPIPNANSSASFGQDSSNARHGTFNSTVRRGRNPIRPIPEEPEVPEQPQVPEEPQRPVQQLAPPPTPTPAPIPVRRTQRAPHVRLIRRRAGPPWHMRAGTAINQGFSWLWETIYQSSPSLSNVSTLVTIASIILISMYLSIADDALGRATREYFHQAKHAMEQYTPHGITDPLYYSNVKEVKDLRKRMYRAESDITKLKHDVNYNRELAERIEKQLPNFIVGKRIRGQVEVPIDFWRALKSNILTDTDIKASQAGKPGKTPVSVDWEEFLRNNEARLKGMIHDDVVLAKADITTLIETNMKTSKSHTNDEIAKMRKRIDKDLIKANSSLNKEQVRILAEEAVQRSISGGKVEALINSKLKDIKLHSLRRFNHFGLGGGVVVVPAKTSATYDPRWYKSYIPLAGWAPRSLLWSFAYPSPTVRRDIDALTKWDEQGDCWCGAASREGAGVQLGVMTARALYPDEVVVEHVHHTATLDPGATPRRMELFARIALREQDAVAGMSEKRFKDAPRERVLDDSWVRIAEWTYDVNAQDNVQVFPVQLRLAAFGVPAKEFVVRARSNWGGEEHKHTCFYRIRMHGEVAGEATQ